MVECELKGLLRQVVGGRHRFDVGVGSDDSGVLRRLKDAGYVNVDLPVKRRGGRELWSAVSVTLRGLSYLEPPKQEDEDDGDG